MSQQFPKSRFRSFETNVYTSPFSNGKLKSCNDHIYHVHSSEGLNLIVCQFFAGEAELGAQQGPMIASLNSEDGICQEYTSKALWEATSNARAYQSSVHREVCLGWQRGGGCSLFHRLPHFQKKPAFSFSRLVSLFLSSALYIQVARMARSKHFMSRKFVEKTCERHLRGILKVSDRLLRGLAHRAGL